MSKKMSPQPIGFYITGRKGFHITFENGWTISVQFGPGNYCNHHDRAIGYDEEACGKEGSLEAEVAYWPPGGELQPFEDGDTVKGYVGPKDVLALMNEVAKK